MSTAMDIPASASFCKRRRENPSLEATEWFGCAGVKIRQPVSLCLIRAGMKHVELYAKVRHAVRIEGLSKRAAARRFGIDPRTVDKMLEFSVPPGYRRSKPPVRPKLGAFITIIDAILAEDKSRPRKQQHTSKRIFEQLRDEHGFTGGMTIVKDYVALCRQR